MLGYPGGQKPATRSTSQKAKKAFAVSFESSLLQRFVVMILSRGTQAL